MNTIDLVRKFHDAFGVRTPATPDIGDGDTNGLRLYLLREELIELSRALAEDDKVATLDALTDLQYVLDGAYLALGFAHLKDEAFAEVHRANMSKLGSDGKPILREDGKIMKGPGYTPPNLQPLLS